MLFAALGGGLRLVITLGLVAVAVVRWARHPRASMFAIASAVIAAVTQGLLVVLPRLAPPEATLLVVQSLQVVGTIGYALLAAAVFVERGGAAVEAPRSRW